MVCRRTWSLPKVTAKHNRLRRTTRRTVGRRIAGSCSGLLRGSGIGYPTCLIERSVPGGSGIEFPTLLIEVSAQQVRRRGGRVAEGNGLLNRHRAKSSV